MGWVAFWREEKPYTPGMRLLVWRIGFLTMPQPLRSTARASSKWHSLVYYARSQFPAAGLYCLIILAGLPATTEYGGTSLVTTEPPATTLCFPMVTPAVITEFAAIQQSSSTVICDMVTF